MIKYLEFNVNEVTIRLCFTRMTEEDTWVCQMTDEIMNDIEEIIDPDF
jgi:hypothetical protein